MGTIRLFLAIRLLNALEEQIAELQKEVKKTDVDAKFVEKENLHINLKFLGSKTKKEAEEIKNCVKEAISNFKKFEIEIKGMGAFPSKSYIRVLWLGIGSGKNRLEQLYDELENNFEKIGIPKESREFSPHITLCRLRSQKNKNLLKEIISKYEHKSFGKLKVDALFLIQSKLSPKGPKYINIEKFDLID